VAGTLGGISYDVGDWIISDGVEWQKVAASNTAVTSFQGRKGIVNLIPADYLSLKSATTPFKIPGSSFYDILLPVPHNFPGYQSYISYLRGYSESNYMFPLSLVIPNGIGNITTILGVNLFLLIYLFYKCIIPYNKLLILITLYLIFCIILGQRSSRFYLEIFLFISIYIYHFGNFDDFNFSTFYLLQKLASFLCLLN
jgi:hypothetical protein